MGNVVKKLPMYRMGQKVKIISEQKIDGRHNIGIVVGIEKDNHNLIALSEKHFFDYFEITKYKVAYVDCATNRCNTKWFRINELEKA